MLIHSSVALFSSIGCVDVMAAIVETLFSAWSAVGGVASIVGGAR
jgi:hypothetical protein